MKTPSLLARTLLAASFLSVVPLAAAQAPTPSVASPEPRPLPPPTMKQEQKLNVFSCSADTLKMVIDLLQENLEGRNFERMNILIAPGTEDAQVPDLDLRDVTGPEALSLIASAASCRVEPIYPPRAADGPPPPMEAIVGYKLISEQPSGWRGGRRSAPSPLRTTDPFAPSKRGGPAGMGSISIFGGGAGMRGGGESRDLAGGESSGSGGIFPSSPYGIPGMSPGGSFASGGGIETRVYPLATISAASAFDEIKKTLDDVLSTSGVQQDQVKLGFHEKTNVLVLRGPAEAQAVVAQLLTALETNVAKTSERESTSKVTTLELQLHATKQELERMRKLLDESDARGRDLENDYRKLESQVPKKE